MIEVRSESMQARAHSVVLEALRGLEGRSGLPTVGMSQMDVKLEKGFASSKSLQTYRFLSSLNRKQVHAAKTTAKRQIGTI